MVNQDIDNIKKIILQTVPCEQIYLFGSHAYGVPSEDSDYDFFVVVPDSGKKPNDAADDIYHALYKKTNKKSVDVLVKTYTDFEHRKILPTLERTVYQKGIVLHG